MGKCTSQNEIIEDVLMVCVFSVIILVVVVGFCFCIGAVRLLNFYLPQISLPQRLAWLFSKYLSKPALLGSRHLKRLPGDLGYVPSRR